MFKEEELYISPTLITGVEFEDAFMKDEIFGPILPILCVESVDAAIEFINARYFFYWE